MAEQVENPNHYLMPAPRIRADHELLKRVVQEFHRASAATKRSLARLRSNKEALQAGDWIGQGATKFYQEMDSQVLPAVERLHLALNQGAQTVQHMSGVMEEAEAEAARLLGMLVGAGAAAAAGRALGQAAGSLAGRPAGEGSAAGQGDNDPMAQTLSQFDDRVHELVRASPTLQSQIEQLQQAGWTVEEGPAGGGSYADRDTQRIVIDSSDSADLQAGGLAHEAAHALSGEPPFHRPTPEMTREQFVDQNVAEHLHDEANAQFHEAQVRHEVQQATGTDIGISGVQSAEYGRIYREFSEGNLTRDQAIDQMATAFEGEVTSTTNQNYRDYYAETYQDWWDQNVAPGRRNQ
jgi:WXG100 family type VII secretion target